MFRSNIAQWLTILIHISQYLNLEHLCDIIFPFSNIIYYTFQLMNQF
jgi:hypothetical protein